jgi:hypothetical protein
MYSLCTRKESRFGQRYGLQNTTLTSCFYKNIYQKVIYVYFYESIFQDKSIHTIFTFLNSTIWELFMIYIPKVWLKPCPKQLPLRVRREYIIFFLDESLSHTLGILVAPSVSRIYVSGIHNTHSYQLDQLMCRSSDNPDSIPISFVAMHGHNCHL